MRILIGGDFVPQKRVKKFLDNGLFEPILSELKSVTNEVDFTIVNLEAPIVVSEQCKPIEKVGPHLRADASVITALKYAGVDAVTLANNHIRDYGDWGVNDTINNLSRNGIKYVGAGLDIEESQTVLYVKIKGEYIAFINCCEHEFSIADKAKAGANPINAVKQYNSIKEAKKKASYVVVIVHGGIEYYPYPTPRMQELYRFYIDAGADVVVNHHQHCFSGFESYLGKPIVYGIGNLSFDRDDNNHSFWNEGYLVQLDLDVNCSPKMKLIPYFQADRNPGIRLLKSSSARQSFEKRVIELNEIISCPEYLQNQHRSFMKNTRRGYLAALSPYWGRLSSLYIRHLLPGIMTKKKWINLLSKIQCESHLERFIDMIYSEIDFH